MKTCATATKFQTYDGTARTPAVAVQRIVSLLVEGPMLWLARRNGICKGFPHRIEFREDFFRINGKPYFQRCAEKVIGAHSPKVVPGADGGGAHWKRSAPSEAPKKKRCLNYRESGH